MILNKKQMTEEDIKLQYITPAIQAKWGLDRITMETKITDGRINLKGNIVIRDRQRMADDGIIIVVMTLDSVTGLVLDGPDIVSRGFVYVRNSEALMDEMQRVVDEKMEQIMDRRITDWSKIKTEVKDAIGDFVWKETKRRPMILPIIMEV